MYGFQRPGLKMGMNFRNKYFDLRTVPTLIQKYFYQGLLESKKKIGGNHTFLRDT